MKVARSRRGAAVADESVRHVPVLLAEVLAALDCTARTGMFLDGTFGAGGYTGAVLDASADNRVIGIDRDPDAIRSGAELVARSSGRLRLLQGRFGDLEALASAQAPDGLDGAVLDIGVSSMQLDQPDRGFSFRRDGPLDMRMERDGPSAADLVNEAEEAEIADILFHYGEERRSRAIARAILERRRRAPFTTTSDLADLVAQHVRAEPGHHPATRTFQALRIAVNDELGQLLAGLEAAERALKPGGRLAVVTFHSLEDRIVKQFFASRTGRASRGSRHLPEAPGNTASFQARVRGPVAASEGEMVANPRARSAKLRWAERTDAPPLTGDGGVTLPGIGSLALAGLAR